MWRSSKNGDIKEDGGPSTNKHHALLTYTGEGFDYMKNDFNSRSKKKVDGINFVKSPQLLPIYWASVSAAFQTVLEKFIVSSNWSLSAFKKLVLKHGIQVVLNSTLTYAGDVFDRKKHFQLAYHCIFEAAKFQWLAPWKKISTIGITTCLKRQVGGLYLLYIVAMEQVGPQKLFDELQTINFDNEDLASIRCFFEDMEKLILGFGEMGMGICQNINSVYMKLREEKLFSLTVVKDTFECNPAEIYFLEAKNHPAFYHHGRIKDIRDTYLYIINQGVVNSLFKNVMASIRRNCNELDGQGRKDEDGIVKENKFPLAPKKNWTVADVEDLYKERDIGVLAIRIIEIFKFLTPPNVITESRLTGTENIAHILRKEVADIQENNRKNFKWRKEAPSRQRKTKKPIDTDQCWSNFDKYLRKEEKLTEEDQKAVLAKIHAEIEDKAKKVEESLKKAEIVDKCLELKAECEVGDDNSGDRWGNDEEAGKENVAEVNPVHNLRRIRKKNLKYFP